MVNNEESQDNNHKKIKIVFTLHIVYWYTYEYKLKIQALSISARITV